jgi:hypothetical protein
MCEPLCRKAKQSLQWQISASMDCFMVDLKYVVTQQKIFYVSNETQRE